MRPLLVALPGVAVFVCLSAGGLSAAEQPSAAAVEFFEKKVRPVLVASCHECHSTGKKRRGGLLLDSRAAVLKGGESGPAVVPGQPHKSLLVKAISYADELRMPPRTRLSAEQIADLTRWVQMGAPWPGGGAAAAGQAEAFDFDKRRRHWSFQPVRVAAVPAVRDNAWTKTPIDRFLLAKLEARGFSPAPPADRRTLIRRLTFDLTGLPPSPEEIDAFLAERRPGAYERLVDRLLASPAYGERWGRHWLDLMRFAETSGHEFDFDIPHAHGYRDYVIRAFNDDVPYDRFVQEHIAGDLLSDPRRHPVTATNESIVGTGFWFLGESKHSPVDLRGDGGDRRDNMIDVFGKAFLGLTVSCARCHDHKFDPIYTKDYYSLVSYLQSSRMQRAFIDPPERIGRPAAALHRLRHEAAEPAIARTAAALQRRLGDLADALLKEQKRRGTDRPDRGDVVFADFANGYRGWAVTGDAFGAAPAGPRDVHVHAGAVTHIARGAHSGLASRRLHGAIRSRTFTIEKSRIHYRAAGHGTRVRLIIDGFQQIRAPIYGGLEFALRSPQPRWHTQDVGMWLGHRAYIEVLDDGDGWAALERVHFSDRSRPHDAPNPLLASLVAAATAEEVTQKCQQLVQQTVRAWGAGQLTDAAGLDLVNAVLASPAAARLLPGKGEEDARQAELAREIARREAALPLPRRALAMADGTPVQERVHIRGNPRTLGEEAPRRLPVVFGDDPRPPQHGSGRLRLAQRLTAADNPLLARVLVNRLWQHHFGSAIVRTPDDFGAQGERPSHPELLDWLAAELVRADWSMKHLHRLMVLSGAYQMASRGEAAAARADPRNELLHRMPVRRLEAEGVRDAMLTVSGRLDRTMGGPGPAPHLTEFMLGRGRPAASGPLDGNGRRSVYLNVRRNFLHPMFLAFDYPTPFSTIGRRGVSNVPAQALTLMNNPFVTQQARLWAERELSGAAASDRERVTRMYQSAFGRHPTAEELAAALAFLDEQGKDHGAKDVRAWADLAHVLFNVKEFIFVN